MAQLAESGGSGELRDDVLERQEGQGRAVRTALRNRASLISGVARMTSGGLGRSAWSSAPQRQRILQLILKRYVQMTKAVLAAHLVRRGIDPAALVVPAERETSSTSADSAETDKPSQL